MVEPKNTNFYREAPPIGVNTRRLRGEVCRKRIMAALDAGVRCIDTAQSYENEIEVGQAIQQSGVPRDELFVITKVRISDYRPYDLLWSVRESLDRLRIDQFDLVLLQGVHPNLGLKSTLDALWEAETRGLTNHIGVADFNAAQYSYAWEMSGGTLSCNEIEYHPFINRDAELQTAKDCDSVVMAYAPLAMGAVNMSALLIDIAAEINRSPAQVALRWMLQQDNVIALPQPAEEHELRELLCAQEFELDAEQMSRIDTLKSENLTLYPDPVVDEPPSAAA